MNGQDGLEDPFPNTAKIVDDVGFKCHAWAQGASLAKCHHMLGSQLNLDSVQRFVALRGSHECGALAMRQILRGNGCAAYLEDTAFGQSKLLIWIGGQAKPYFLTGLNEAGGASGRKQRCNQSVCRRAGRI